MHTASLCYARSDFITGCIHKCCSGGLIYLVTHLLQGGGNVHIVQLNLLVKGIFTKLVPSTFCLVAMFTIVFHQVQMLERPNNNLCDNLHRLHCELHSVQFNQVQMNSLSVAERQKSYFSCFTKSHCQNVQRHHFIKL